MKTTICLLTITMLFSACNSALENKTTEIVTAGFPNLDGIDKVNNESVMASGDNITKAFVFLN
jgi:hypothetical protein